jgi:hypothetical protein
MQLCSPDAPGTQPDQRLTFKLAPAGTTIQPIEPCTVSNAQAPGNGLDRRDLADDAELIHTTLCHTPRGSSISLSLDAEADPVIRDHQMIILPHLSTSDKGSLLILEAGIKYG